MANKAVTFKALTPEKHIDNLDYYEEALDFALADEETINIAITGIYGSGKTSVLESYKNKETSSKTFEKSDYLHISLADFEQSNADKDNGKHDISDKVLEGKILNQLLHQVNTKKIPQSIFRLKRNISKWRVLLSTAFIILFIINLFLVWRFPGENLKTVFLIIFFAQLSCIIYFLVRLQLNKRIFKRLSIRSKNIESDIEIFEDSDSSYFDKYLDDVIYLFYNSGAKVIVFEDLDRFDNNLIFAKLKEINTLVNNRKNKNEKIKFIYMIKDDMFLSKDRTKFFDFILPIIPFINPSNSYDELRSLLEQQSDLNDSEKVTLFELFDSKFLLKLSIYIDDMRLLKNIVNEFLIYHGRLNQITLNVNKLLAFIVYKNIFPNDFAKIQINRGFVYHLFNNKEAYIEHEKNRLTEEIKELNLRIEASTKEHLKSKHEIYALFFDGIKNYFNIEVNGKQENQFTNRSEFIKEIINADYKVQGKGYYNRIDNIDLSENFKRIESQSEFNQRLKAIEDKNNIEELREVTQRKIDEKKKLFDMKLHMIISRKDIETAEKQHFAKTELNETSTFQEIKRSPYFDLLVFLITGGYIDEDYHSYITYFHEKSLTVSDKEFLRTVYDSHNSEGFRYETKLNRIIEIYNRLDTSDFMKKEVLNFDLFNYILTNKSLAHRSENMRNLFTQIYQTNNIGFFMELYNQLEKKARFEILNQLNGYAPSLFEKIIRDENIVEKDKCEVVADALSIYTQNQLAVLENKQETLKIFVQDSNILLYQQIKYTQRFMDNINYLRIKFTKVEFERLDSKLRNYVYEKDLYAINLENISSVLKYFYGHKNSQDITHQNYTLVSKENNSFLKEYIEKNINSYIEKYLMFSEGIILDEPNAVYTIINNNDDIDDNNKIKYINILDQKKILLNKLETTNYYTQLIEGRNLAVNAENILLYFQFSEDKWTSELVDFVNLNQKDFEFVWPDNSDRFDEDFKKTFFKATVGEDNLDNVVYQIILSELKLTYPNGFTLNNLSDKKMNILIEINIIKFSKENLTALRKDHPFSVINFASKYLSDYLQLMEETDYYRYEELLEALDFYKDSTTDIQKSIIDVIFEPISIVKKSLNPYVLNYILENKIDITDLPYIIQYYNSYKKITKKVIIQVVANNVDNVITNKIDLTKTILNKLLVNREIDIEDRQLLFSRNIQEIERKELKDNFEFLELESFIEVVNEHRRNVPFIINETNQNILRYLKVRNLISSYKKEGNYYNVNSKQERNLI